MFWLRYRLGLLVGVLALGAATSARADDKAPAAQAAPAADPCTPMVKCIEWVPEQYTTKRTVYRTEYKQETYTAYRCESVPETKTYNVTVCKQVPETRTETRRVCVSVPTVEEREVMQTFVTCKPVTTTVRKCVDKGHYECREVPCHEGCLAKLCRKKSCGDCCEPCCPPPTKTVKVWVPCKVWEEVPCTKMERVCETRPVKCKVTVCKTEVREEKYQVTCYKSVPEQQTRTCTVMTTRQVPYQATRNVAVCVPHEETVTMCRMVAKVVERPAAPCAPVCGETDCCTKNGRHHRCAGLFSRHNCCD
jgi:hypothetical protein